MSASRPAAISSPGALIGAKVIIAEIIWLQDRFAGRAVEIPDETVHPDDSPDSAVAFHQQTWRPSDAIVRGSASPAGNAVKRGHRMAGFVWENMAHDDPT